MADVVEQGVAAAADAGCVEVGIVAAGPRPVFVDRAGTIRSEERTGTPAQMLDPVGGCVDMGRGEIRWRGFQSAGQACDITPVHHDLQGTAAMVAGDAVDGGFDNCA